MMFFTRIPIFTALATLGLGGLLTACTLPSSLPATPSGSPEPLVTASSSTIRVPTTLIRPGVITFLSSTDYPPQESIDNGKPVGFDIDMAQALAAKIGLAAQIKSTPFEVLIPSLLAKQGDAIISAMTVTPDRQKRVAFVGYFQAGESIVVRKGNPENIAGLRDLCGKRAAAEVATTEAQTLTGANGDVCKATPINIQFTTTDTEALKLVQAGSVDAAIDASPVAAYFVEQAPDAYQVAAPPIQSTAQGIAVNPSNAELLKALQQAMVGLMLDGTYHTLLMKWNLLDGEIPASQVILTPSPAP
jgi:polar amino acid transport system substrate-binding protein